MRKKAFLVVGHSNWGKSWTLRKLTNDNVRQTRISINEQGFFIRRISNDDNPDSLLKFAQKGIHNKGNNVILTFCPNFEKKESKEILELLNPHFELHFFVIKYQQHPKKDGVVSDTEIKELRKYSDKSEIYSKKDLPKNIADDFQKFIQANL